MNFHGRQLSRAWVEARAWSASSSGRAKCRGGAVVLYSLVQQSKERANAVGGSQAGCIQPTGSLRGREGSCLGVV